MSDWLCTVAQAKGDIKMTENQVVDEPWLISNIPMVSARINNMTRLRFVPWKETYKYDALGPGIGDIYRKLDLGRPLLYPIEVIDASQQVLELGVDYIMKPQDSSAWQLQRINASGMYGWFWIAPTAFLNAISVEGVWAYRTNYPDEGWTDSLQTLDGAINATVRTIPVSAVLAADEYGFTPALSAGNTIQIDDEWMLVTGTDATANTINVLRHYNGSTAAIHADDAPIYTWSVQPEINRAALRWLGYMYSRRGAYESVKTDLSAGKTMIYPSDAPAEVMHIIEQTLDWRWGVV